MWISFEASANTSSDLFVYIETAREVSVFFYLFSNLCIIISLIITIIIVPIIRMYNSFIVNTSIFNIKIKEPVDGQTINELNVFYMRISIAVFLPERTKKKNVFFKCACVLRCILMIIDDQKTYSLSSRIKAHQ